MKTKHEFFILQYLLYFGDHFGYPGPGSDFPGFKKIQPGFIAPLFKLDSRIQLRVFKRLKIHKKITSWMVVLYWADVHKVGLHVTVGGQETRVPLLGAVHAPLRVEHNLNRKHLGFKNPRTFSLKCAKTLMGKNPRGFYLTSGRNK
jgi:hypothetical protein